MKHKIFDMLTDAQKTTNLGAGKAYDITDYAALPAAFTADFTAVTLTAGAATSGATKELGDSLYCGIQVICTAKGAGFSALDVKLQESNIGGTLGWCDVASATITTLTDVGSGFIATVNERKLTSKFYRVVMTATGGTATVYVIAHGVA